MTPDLPLVPAAAPPFARPQPLDLTFEGFPAEGFEALARLRAEPHIGRYQKEKAVLDRAVTAPFKRYRDDLAVNWVLPNGLPFETERNVFSRILKNDFGRGGSHSHLWMSFYRRPRKRLTDVQLSHAIHADAFRWGLYIGDYAKGLFGPARRRLVEEPEVSLPILNALIDRGYRLSFAPHVTKPEGHPEFDTALDALPDGLDTVVGERGSTLSGGQRQRLAIARALLRRPRVLVLDDSTSAVDPTIEAGILRNLRVAPGMGRSGSDAAVPTLLVIAHRLATIRMADRVLFLEGGSIAASGSHEELLDVPAYATLARAYEEAGL